MNTFEVGSKVWFVDEIKPRVWHLLVAEEIVKKTLEGTSHDYLFLLPGDGSRKQKQLHSKNLHGKFFKERPAAFDFMIEHARTAINRMMDIVELKDKEPDLKPLVELDEASSFNKELTEAIVELPDGTRARLKGGIPK